MNLLNCLNTIEKNLLRLLKIYIMEKNGISYIENCVYQVNRKEKQKH